MSRADEIDQAFKRTEVIAETLSAEWSEAEEVLALLLGSLVTSLHESLRIVSRQIEELADGRAET